MPRATKKLDPATQRQLLVRLSRDAERIAKPFGLRYRSIVAERAGTKRRYGACFEDGTIKIRLINVVSGKPLRYSSLLDTLCHELAHLKYWHHGPNFQRFHQRLLDYARDHGLYEPAPAKRAPTDSADAAAGASVETAPAASPRSAARVSRPSDAQQQSQRSPGALPTRSRSPKDEAQRPEQLSLFGP